MVRKYTILNDKCFLITAKCLDYSAFLMGLVEDCAWEIQNKNQFITEIRKELPDMYMEYPDIMTEKYKILIPSCNVVLFEKPIEGLDVC